MVRSTSLYPSAVGGRIQNTFAQIQSRFGGWRVLAGAAMLLGSAAPGAACAEIAFTAAFDGLSCSYSQSTTGVGVLSMRAVNTGAIQSSYEFSRLVNPSGSAIFEAGFVSNPNNPADIVANLNVVRINSSLATASGTMVFTDRVGNTVTCQLSGNVTPIGSLYFSFIGSISDLRFSAISGQQGRFEGSEGGSFELEDVACANPLVGSTTILILRSGATFFTSSFADRGAGGDLQMVGPIVRPCPGDFNCDGGIDGADIGAFFISWEAARVSADINQDGGVDGSDVAAFFEHWEAGC